MFRIFESGLMRSDRRAYVGDTRVLLTWPKAINNPRARSSEESVPKGFLGN